ncbi:alpha/beta fold hydrolase [Janthinobacterium sp. LB2P70]|uniref:alpha/beta fold hydrolase n=1 Tax=Janthinobacterium sp. LB2P70 TaxID=3424197 RepID=UPI003F211D09
MTSFIKPLSIAAVVGTLFASIVPASPASAAGAVKPTIVLVHGAFADASSWDGVAAILQKDGYTVIGAANHLRSVKSDADSVARVVNSVPGAVVLVGHSYGGSVISAAAQAGGNVKALVYVAAFAPDAGETAAGLSGKYPGGTLGTALAKPVPLADGSNDLFIEQAKFHDQFAADLPAAKARLMAVGQRPITDAALNEASPAPGWKGIPSWFVYGKADKNIPAEALAFMAKRANAKKTIVIDGASHVVMSSHPAEVAKLIEEAAGSVK